jgi:transposase
MATMSAPAKIAVGDLLNADKLATAAMRAAQAQHVRVPGEAMAGELIARLASNVIELDRQLAELDKLIADRFQSHRHAKVIASIVGIGDLLGAELLSATGGSLDGFASADRLAGYAGLAPHHATPADASATCTAPRDTTASSNASSTPQP